MCSHSLFTIGYQGLSSENFMRSLLRNGVEVLVDVRYTPWSHKAAFCRRQLAGDLGSHGIAYVHLPQFGAAPALRRALRGTGDWQTFAAAYVKHLRSLNGELELALGEYQGMRLCLLCMEANPSECHRSILAEEICGRGLAPAPVHL